MKLKNMMYISLFAAIIGVLGLFPPIFLPLIPVPITLQTLGVMLAGGILGANRGALSLLLFLFLVVIGAPLLASGGGIAPLIGPGGGYILSWPLAAWVIGYFVEKNYHAINFSKAMLFTCLGGIALVYLCGVSYLSWVGQLPWGPTAVSSLVFLPGDLVKAIIASYVIVKMSRAYPMMKKVDKDKQLKRVG